MQHVVMKAIIFFIVSTTSCASLHISNLLKSCKNYKYSIQLKDINPHSVVERDSEGKTPLHYLVCRKNIDPELIEIIYSINPEVIHLEDNNGEQPLHKAAFNGNVGAVKTLLQFNASVNATTHTGATPCHRAVMAECFSEAVAILKLLKVYNADINCQNKNGITPLHVAAYNESFSMVSFLISAGADYTKKDNHEKTPIMILQKVISLLPPSKIIEKQLFLLELIRITTKFSATSG